MSTCRLSSPARLAVAMLALLAVPALGQGRTVRIEESGQGAERLIRIENDFLKLALRPGLGARVVSLTHKTSGRELTVPPAEGVRGGLLSDQLWQQSYWHSDWNSAPYSVEIQERGPARARLVASADGVRWRGVAMRKTIVVEAGRCAVDVEHEVTGGQTADARGRGDLWIHNGLTPGAIAFLPAEPGVLRRPVSTEVETWEFNPTRGWIAALLPDGPGLAASMDFVPLRALRTARLQGVASLEWVLRKADLKPGSRVQVRSCLAPFAGLSAVDGACRGLAVEIAAGKPAASTAVEVRVAAFEDGPVEATTSLRRLPAETGAQVDRRRLDLAADRVASFRLDLNTAEAGSYVLSLDFTRDGKRLLQCEKLLVVGRPSGVYAMSPEASRRPEFPDYSTWQRYHPLDFNFNSTGYVTPHRVWAKPYAGGRPRALVIVPGHNARQAVELAQRLDLDITVPFAVKETYYALGDRYRSLHIKEVHAALESAIVGKPFDVIITSNTAGWDLLTEPCRKHILKLVQDGAGLLMMQRGKEPPELSAALPMDFLGYDWASGRWEPMKSRNPVLKALPYEAMPNTHSSNGSRMRLSKEKEADGLEDREPAEPLLQCARPGAVYPIIAVNTWGKGRVVQMSIGLPLIPGSYQVRGRSLDEPPPFDYWEYHYALFGRLIYWAARRPSGVDLDQIACGPDGVKVLLRTAKPATAEIEVTLRDEFGVVLHSERRAETALKTPTSRVEFHPPANVCASSLVADVIVRSERGVLAWGAGAFVRKAAAIESVKLDRPLYAPSDQAQVEARLNAPPQAGRVVAEVWDGAGRHVATVSAPAMPTTRLALPLARVLGPMFEARVHLQDGLGVTVDQAAASANIALPPEDARRRFQTLFWGGAGAEYPTHLIREIYRLYGHLGMTASHVGVSDLEHDQRELDRLDMPFTRGSVGMAWTAGVSKADREAKADFRGGVGDPGAFDQAREAAAKFMAQHKPKGYNLLMYTMGDENRGPGADICFSRAALAGLRDWLRKTQYKSLDDLNAEWATQFKSWDEVMPMTEAEAREHGAKTGSYAAWADHRQYNKWAYAQLAQANLDGFRTVDPDVRAGASGTQEPHVVGGRDWSLLIRAYNALLAYSGTQSRQQESYRPDLLRYSWAGYGKPNPILRTGTWMHLGDVDRGIAFFSARCHIDPDLTLPECGRDLRATLGEMVRGQGQLLIEAAPVRAPVFMLQSSASIHGEHMLGLAEVGKTGRTSLEAMFLSLGLPHQAVSYEQVAAGELERKGARALFLPHVAAMSREEAEAIRRWVRAGGVLIADMGTAVMTQHARRLKAGQLDDVFGLDRSKAEAKKAQWTVAAEADASVAATVVESGLAGAARPRWTAKAEAASTPVLFTNAFGKGRAHYFAFDAFSAFGALGEKLLDPAGYAAAAAVRAVVAEAVAPVGWTPPVRLVPRQAPAAGGTWEPYVNVYPKTAGDSLFVVLARDYDVDRQGAPDRAAALEFARDGYLYDVLAGKELGHGRRLDLALNSFTVRVLALLPYRVAGLDVECPEQARQGEDAKLAVSAVAEGGRPGLHVFRLDVIGPDGQPRERYSRNLVAPQGRVETALPLALNDAPGAWRIRLVDVASGVTAERALNVAAAPAP